MDERMRIQGSAKLRRKRAKRLEREAEMALARGDLAELATTLEALRELRPTDHEVHHRLGQCYGELRRLSEAVASLERARELAPDHVGVLSDLGLVWSQAGHWERALALLEHAHALDPDEAGVRNRLGMTLYTLGQTEAAEAQVRAAVELQPGFEAAWLNLCVIARAKDQPRAALAYLERIRSEAMRASKELFSAFPKLMLGELAEGWACYERRFERGLVGHDAPALMRAVQAPRWQGESLAGRRLLVWREQGLGDELFFGSCLTDLVGLGGHVILECEPRLVGLFQRTYPEFTVRAPTVDADGRELVDPSDYDCQVPIGSLPLYLRPELASFERHAPRYLLPDSERAALWRRRLARLGPGPKIGICWRSGNLRQERTRHYAELTEWAEVLQQAGVHFVNLQYGDCEAELIDAEALFGVRIERWPDLDLKGDLESVGALMAGLDFVISVGTAVAEQAAAMGAPVLRLALANSWDDLGQARYPWWPNVELVRRPWDRPWSEVLSEVAVALTEWRDAQPQAHPQRALLDQALAEAERLDVVGDAEQAVQYAEQVLELAPETWRAALLLARLASRRGRYTLALQLLERALPYAPAGEGLQHDLALLLLALGEHDEARAALRRAILARPEDTSAFDAFVAASRSEAGLEARGERFADWLEQVRPFWIDAALEAQQQGRLDEAERRLRRALLADPHHPEALHRLGMLALQREAPAMALRWLERALALTPGLARAHAHRGLALYRLGRFTEAAAAYRQALVSLPDDADLHSDLAAALLRAGDPAAAVAACGRALVLDPTHAGARTNLAHALARSGRSAEPV